MFSPKTVFVVGAGASCDFGFPTGDALRIEISRTLSTLVAQVVSFDDPFIQAVHNISSAEGKWREYIEAAERLIAALPLAISIDNLLHAHRNDNKMIILGKLAICWVILNHERTSPLFKQGSGWRGSIQGANMESPALNKSWYLPLMRLLGMGKNLDQLSTLFDNVAFVVWNYDRCIEHFLVNAVIDYFNVPPELAANAMNNINIVHPYGRVGKLRWQEGADPTVDFGDQHPPLSKIAESILTFTESAEEGVREQARDLVENAETLVFMGFGFLPQNMGLLTVEHGSSVNRVFATTFGIGDNDVAVVRAEIGEMIQRDAWDPGKLRGQLTERSEFIFYPEFGTCRDLMDHNWLRLSRS
jgi:hypothetical protein